MADKLKQYDAIRVVEILGKTVKPTTTFWKIKGETLRVQVSSEYNPTGGNTSDIGQTFEYTAYQEPVFSGLELDEIYWVNWYLSGDPKYKNRTVNPQPGFPPKVMIAQHSYNEIMSGDYDDDLPAFLEPLTVRPSEQIIEGYDEEDKHQPPSTVKPPSNYDKDKQNTRASIERQTSLKAAVDLACSLISARSSLYKPLIDKYVETTNDPYEKQVDTIRAVSNSIRPDVVYVIDLAEKTYEFISNSKEDLESDGN